MQTKVALNSFAEKTYSKQSMIICLCGYIRKINFQNINCIHFMDMGVNVYFNEMVYDTPVQEFFL